MTVVSTLSNHYKKEKMDGNIDFGSDEFRLMLMNTTFSFDKDTHATYGDVCSDELSTGNGYTQSGEILLSGELTEDDTNDRGNMAWGNLTFTASGGDIGPTGAAVIFDNTSSDDTVVGCIDFGTDYTIGNGSSFQLQSIVVRET